MDISRTETTEDTMGTTITTAADRIAEVLSIDPDEALNLATAYAIQLDVETGTQEGGQAPAVEIDDETLIHIVGAAIAADPRAAAKRDRVIADWRGRTPDLRDVAIETELCAHVPELGALYQRWLTLFVEDQEAHTAAQPRFDPVNLTGFPAEFTPAQWRPETRAARKAYDDMLEELAR